MYVCDLLMMVNLTFSFGNDDIIRKKELGGSNSNKELHMFVWSSSASPVSEANLRNAVNHAASTDFAAAPPPPMPIDGATPKGDTPYHTNIPLSQTHNSQQAVMVIAAHSN